MFDKLFGWRKASKCKKLIRNVQCRLKLLKNKRSCIIRHVCGDVAELLKLGYEKKAFSRVEQLFIDKTIMAVYDLLDDFCEFIILHLQYIRNNRDCPNDINEAVSTLIYAAPRCGDLPELQKLRKLFGERYGHRFAVTAVELLPGNLVDSQIIEKLCIKSIPDDVKYGLLDEIAKDYSFQYRTTQKMENAELQNHQMQIYNLPAENGKPQAQVNGKEIQDTYHSKGTDKAASHSEYIPRKTLPSSLKVSENLKITKSYSSAVVVTQPSIDSQDSILSPSSQKNAVRAGKRGELDPSLKHRLTHKLDSGSNLRLCSSRSPSNFSEKHKVEVTTTTSESSYEFPEITVVYPEDIEESNATTKDDKNKDQRVFMFKSSHMFNGENLGSELVCWSEFLYGQNDTEKQLENKELQDGRERPSSSRMRTKSSRKRLTRRSHSLGSHVSHYSMTMNDVDSANYYGDSCSSSPNEYLFRNTNYHQRKHQHTMPIEDRQSSKFRNHKKKLPLLQQDEDRGETKKEFCGKTTEGKQFNGECRQAFGDCRIDHDMVMNCSLEDPCYFSTRSDKENICVKQEKGTITGMSFPSQNCQQRYQGHYCSSPNEEAFKGSTAINASVFKARSGNIHVQKMGWGSSPQSNCKDMVSVCAFTDYRTHPNKMKEEESVEQEVISDSRGSGAFSPGSCSSMASPLEYRLSQPPYVRTPKKSPEQDQNAASSIIQVIHSEPFELKRSNNSSGSSSSSSSSHVHPKLPDYDELAAYFKGLKEQHRQEMLNQASNVLTCKGA